MKRLSVPVAVLGLLLLTGGQAMAGPILDFTGGVQVISIERTTQGWRFTVTSPITVSALGLWDEGANGLVFPHQLGLWSCGGLFCSTGTLLASTTITTFNSTPVASTSSAGDWRFTPIASLTLAPGDYVVGASVDLLDLDLLRVNTNVPSTIPGVTFDFAREAGPGIGLTFPLLDSANNPGVFGPNLFVGPLAVATPEPSALLLLGSGLAGLAGLAWRRDRRK